MKILWSLRSLEKYQKTFQNWKQNIQEIQIRKYCLFIEENSCICILIFYLLFICFICHLSFNIQATNMQLRMGIIPKLVLQNKLNKWESNNIIKMSSFISTIITSWYFCGVQISRRWSLGLQADFDMKLHMAIYGFLNLWWFKLLY